MWGNPVTNYERAQTDHGDREDEGEDLNSRNDEAGFKIIAGTARQMGLEVVE